MANDAAAAHVCMEGDALAAKGDHGAALARYERSLALAPRLAAAQLGRANALAFLGQPLAALAAYDAFIALDSRFAPAHNNRGLALERLGRHAEALASFETALWLRPDYATAHNNRGCALRGLGRAREALASFEQALALSPGFVEATNNRGNALLDLDRPDAALASYDAATAASPDFADAHRNRGAALYQLGRPQEAAASYERAFSLDPGRADARYEMGLAKLLAGDFGAGWRLHEARKQLHPERYGWLGRADDLTGNRDLAGASVLAVGEQGFGDTIQFVRFIAPLAGRGARVVLCVQPQLKRLLAANVASAVVVDHADDIPEVCCALMSLPLALGLGADPFVSEQPYLSAEPELARAWEARLPERSRPRIGLAWAGAPHHADDARRSIDLARLEPLLAFDAHWISLQRDLRPDDARRLAKAGVTALGEGLVDFADTAALIDRLDLVITVDTSVAHLAGAMGKPVWILLPFAPDWRWGLGRDDSPWYASARLFRQPAPGDWANVVGAVARQLRASQG